MYERAKHHRRSIRLKGYDYSQPGAYFVTIVCQDRTCLLVSEPVQNMVRAWWGKLVGKFPEVKTDAFVIMPNHIHGIVILVGADLCVCPKGQSHGIAPTIGFLCQMAP